MHLSRSTLAAGDGRLQDITLTTHTDVVVGPSDIKNVRSTR